MNMTPEHGPLALCKYSHRWPNYSNLMPNTEEIPDAFKNQSIIAEWATADDIQMGDFIVFHN